jgi:hypothetical protein
MQCDVVTCAPPGQYVVTMCGVDCAGPGRKCVSVPFDYPATSEVVGHLTP